MKRRKLISYFILFWRKHFPKILLVLRAFFWGSFMVLIPLIYGPMFAKIFRSSLSVGYFFCVVMVLVIQIALTDEFWTNGED